MFLPCDLLPSAISTHPSTLTMPPAPLDRERVSLADITQYYCRRYALYCS